MTVRLVDLPPAGRRIVKLDDLTGPQRRLVLSLIDAARKEAAPVVTETSTAAAVEARRVRDERPTTE
jgi:hypothetical protein